MTEKASTSKPHDIIVYLDDGRKFTYRVDSGEKAREHTYAIATTGYRHCEPGRLEHYPVHRISKVVAFGVELSSNYESKASGT